MAPRWQWLGINFLLAESPWPCIAAALQQVKVWAFFWATCGRWAIHGISEEGCLRLLEHCVGHSYRIVRGASRLPIALAAVTAQLHCFGRLPTAIGRLHHVLDTILGRRGRGRVHAACRSRCWPHRASTHGAWPVGSPGGERIHFRGADRWGRGRRQASRPCDGTRTRPSLLSAPCSPRRTEPARAE